MTAGDIVARFTADISGYSAGLAAMAGETEGWKGAVAGAVVGATVAIVAAGAAVAVGAVKMAGDFQSGLTTLVTGAGELESNLGLVSAGILQLATATGTSTTDLTKGMYLIESAGFHGAAALDVLKVSAEGAKVGNADLASVANGVTTILVDYAKSGITAAGATNTLIAAVSLGKTHLSDMANAMAMVLPTAGALGVHLNDVAGALATMTAEGVPAANAATYLRQLLMALEAPASAGAKALKAIGLTTAQVSTEMKVSLPGALQMIMDALAKTYTVGSPQYIEALKAISGGSKQMQGVLDLTGDHLKVFASNVDAVAASVKTGGNAITGWSLVQGDFNFKIEQAKAAVEVFMITLGTLLLPVFSKVVAGIVPMITWLSNLVTAFAGSRQQLQTFSPALGFLSDIFSQIGGIIKGVFSPAINVVITAFSQAGASIAGFIPSGTTLSGVLLSISNYLSGINTTPLAKFLAMLTTTAISAVSQAVSGLVQWFINLGIALGPMIQTALSAVMTALTVLWGWIGKVEAAIVPLLVRMAAWVTSTAGIHAVVVALPPVLTALAVVAGGVLVVAFYSWAAAATAAAVATIAATWPFVVIIGAVALLAAGFVYLYQNSAVFRNALSALWTALQSFWKTLTDVGTALSQTFTPLFVWLGDYIVKTFQPMWTNLVATWQSKVLPALTQLWNAVKGLQPVFVLLAEVVGFILVLAFGLLIGIITGVANGLAGLVTGLAVVITGIVEFVTGLIQIVSGVLQFLYDLITGNWTKLGADLGLIWQGVLNVWGGFWTAFGGIFVTFWDTLWGLLSGFVQGIIQFFQTLYDKIVGHSIVPEMLDMIVTLFFTLPGRILTALGALLATVITFFGNLLVAMISEGGKILAAFSTLFQQLANIIGVVLGTIATAIFASIIASFTNATAQLGIVQTNLTNAIKALPTALVAALATLPGIIAAAFTTAFSLVGVVFQKLIPAVQLIMTQLLAVITASLALLIPLVTVTMTQILTAVRTGLAPLPTIVSQAFAAAFANISMGSVLAQITAAIAAIVNAVRTGLAPLPSIIHAAMQQIVQTVTSSLQGLASIGQQAFASLSASIMTNLNALAGQIKAVIATMVSDLKSQFAQILQMASIFTQLGATIAAALSQAAAQVKQIVDGMVSNLQNTIGSKLADILKQGAQAAGNAFCQMLSQGLLGCVEGLGQNLLGSFGHSMQAIGQLLASAASGWATTWGQNLKTIASDATQIFTDIKGAIGQVLQNIGQMISQEVSNWGSYFSSLKISLPSMPTIPGFAAGVQGFAGGMAIVGEQGPELVTLAAGANVYPLSGRAAGQLTTVGGTTGPGGGAGHTIILQIDGRDLAMAMGSYITKDIRLRTAVRS